MHNCFIACAAVVVPVFTSTDGTGETARDGEDGGSFELVHAAGTSAQSATNATSRFIAVSSSTPRRRTRGSRVRSTRRTGTADRSTPGIRPPRRRARRSPRPTARTRPNTRSQALREEALEAVDREPLLPHRVALPDRDLRVVERVEVDRHAERRPDLVLAPVPPADRAGVVEVARPLGLDQVEHATGLGCQLLVARQRKHGDL